MRAGLEKLLATAPDIEVVGGASDGAEAIELAAESRPDVVLMDLSMPNVDGIEATRAIVAANEDVRVVVLTSMTDRDRILAALDAGAIGYLLKDAEPEEVIAGIRAAARGESPLAPKAASAVLTARATRVQARLSEREREVLQLRHRRPAEQADRAQARDQREDGEDPPDAGLPADRRHRPDTSCALGEGTRDGLRTPRPEAAGAPASARIGLDQSEMAARQVSPPCRAFAFATIRLAPAEAARRRCTEKDPLGATVVRMPVKADAPLRMNVTRQRLPTRF